MKIVGLLGCRY